MVFTSIFARKKSLRGDNFFNNDNNNNFSLPPSSPPTFNNFILSPRPPPQPLLTFNNFSLPPPPPLQTFNQPLPPTFNVFPQLPKRGSIFQPKNPVEATLTRTKPEPEKVIENTDMAIYEIPDPPKIEIGDSLLNILSSDTEDILKDDYVNNKVLEDKTIEQIKNKYNFDDIEDAFDDGQVLLSLMFFLGGENENFVNSCNFYHLTKAIVNLHLFCTLTWDKI